MVLSVLMEKNGRTVNAAAAAAAAVGGGEFVPAGFCVNM